MARHPFYNFDKLLSYNGTYNFVVGGRGIGKTYGAKERAIRSSIKNGDQFIYLRRYKTELATARNTFFADIEHKFPKYDLRANGNIAEYAPVETREEKKRSWKIMGYFISLSTAQTQKSVAFPKVKTIIYDEFIIETGALHYLPDEAIVFNNFYSTVDRYTDKTKVFFLANSVSIMNPYFIEYEIRPDESSEFIRSHEGFIVCHFPDSEAFASSIYETTFGKFIKGTEYAKYAVGNNFADNNENLIGTKDSRYKYYFTLECTNGTFSIWHSSYDATYAVQTKLPKVNNWFTLLPQRITEDKALMTFQDKPLSYLRTAFRTGKMVFDRPSTRNAFTEIFKR